jgi:amino acid transporter
MKNDNGVPKAVILGMLIVVATYLLANVAYLAVLPAFGPGVTLATSPVAAVETATRAAEAIFPVRSVVGCSAGVHEY